jgi:hypothetical protein
MKKMIKLVGNSALIFGVKTNQKLQRFLKEERGEGGPVGNVVGIFITVLLLIGLYILFKEQIDTFVKTMIFGKLNNLS